MDKAILVGLDLNQYNMTTSIKELSGLAKALNIEVLLTMTQKASRPDGATYVGSGKVQEIKQAVDALNADMVIFDDELSPAQIRNLEEILDTQIIDRSFLILSIFSERAKTKGAVLEVSLAQQKYLLPRLIGMGKILSRQGGGSYNAKGPGETKLELDRRTIENNIIKLERQIKVLETQRDTSRKTRSSSNIPLVSLVGYTNAGKSATLNQILKLFEIDNKNVFEKDMLFATLDTTARRITKKGYPTFIITDTIGFLTRLPHEFIKSFKSTLSEVSNSNLILHIVNGIDPEKALHIQTTLDVLKELKADAINQITVYTHADLLDERAPDYEFWISNKTGYHIQGLVESIYEVLFGSMISTKLEIPYDEQHLIHTLNEQTKVLNTEYLNEHILVSTLMYQKQLEPYKPYIVKTGHSNNL